MDWWDDDRKASELCILSAKSISHSTAAVTLALVSFDGGEGNNSGIVSWDNSRGARPPPKITEDGENNDVQ